jgi:hypothetical protein
LSGTHSVIDELLRNVVGFTEFLSIITDTAIRKHVLPHEIGGVDPVHGVNPSTALELKIKVNHSSVTYIFLDGFCSIILLAYRVAEGLTSSMILA